MESSKQKRVLVSGASMAGLSTAFWLNKICYQVAIVETASEPRFNNSITPNFVP